MKTALTLEETKQLSNDDLIATFRFAVEKYNDIDRNYEIANLRYEIGNRILTGRMKIEGNSVKTIFMNGIKEKIEKDELSYDEIVVLAGYPEGTVPTTIYRWQTDNENLADGILLKGQTIKIRDGMIFTVVPTDNA